MGKLLRVLVIICLLLSIGALVLGTMLFKKRELLKGRTQKLETAIIALGTTIEAEPPAEPQDKTYPAKDISQCTPETLEPEFSDFWTKYSAKLEMQDQSKLDLDSHRTDLMIYYKVDPVTGEPLRDPATGYKITKGEGTMQGVLDNLLSKAEEQYNRLNETRQQLTDLRVEQIDTITEMNKRKGELRTALKEIVDLKAKIQEINETIIKPLEKKVEELEEAKRTAEEQISEQQRQFALLEEEKMELENVNAQLKKEIDKFYKSGAGAVSPGFPAPGSTTVPIGINVKPGTKGKVAAVNPKWNFIVLELNDDFLREILGEDLSGSVPHIELQIKRSDEPEKFVTKVRLVDLRREDKLGIADILADWQQLPVKEGDLVFY